MAQSQEEPELTRQSFKRSSVREACGSIAIPSYQPAEKEAVDLIERAKTHPLGVAYLREGALDAVAATFSVHAFVVDHARTLLPAGFEGSGGFDREETTVRTRRRGVKN